MYESLKNNTKDFHLFIFAFDDLSLKILNALSLDKSTIIPLEKFENEKLLNVKAKRTKAEYCWTCTSSTIAYVLDNYEVNECTYVDADLNFFSTPAVLDEELNNSKSILITEHRYSRFSKIYEEKRAGRFCVQYITFKNNLESKMVLSKWIDQCILWCYARFEYGKFGDQKYLDDWPALYNIVKISEHLGAGVAPWNIKQYNIIKNGNLLTGVEKKTGKSFNVVFYHFHFVRFMDNGCIDMGWNAIRKDVIKMIYLPYIKNLIDIEHKLGNSFPEYRTIYYNSKPDGFKNYLKYYFKNLTKFNIIWPAL
jgi:hypothetical protein